jgi:hypothetical protein
MSSVQLGANALDQEISLALPGADVDSVKSRLIVGETSEKAADEDKTAEKFFTGDEDGISVTETILSVLLEV